MVSENTDGLRTRRQRQTRSTGIIWKVLLHRPFHIKRPGGMREAVESAALALRQELACRIRFQIPNRRSQICRSLTPSKSPPAPPRIPPGRPKMRIQLIFRFLISLGTGRAKCKKLMSPSPWCEIASKMQAARPLFHDFHAPTHFSHHIFSKTCFSLQWEA